MMRYGNAKKIAGKGESIRFTKMTGGGNDFVLLDGIRSTLPPGIEKAVASLCARKTGIGADGLVIVSPSAGADCRMTYFNSDGSRAALCGNGVRCTALYVGNRYRAGAAGVTLECGDSLYRADVEGERVRLYLPGLVTVGDPLKIALGLRILTVYPVTVGVPHGVTFQEDISGLDVTGMGREIQKRVDHFPGGINVDFVKLTERQGMNSLAMRTYERGVEDETLCCGTGAVASALAAHRLGYLNSPVEATTRGGETLIVGYLAEVGRYRDVWLEGRVREVFTGEVRLSPRWKKPSAWKAPPP